MPAPQFGLFIPPGPGWVRPGSRKTFVADIRQSLERIDGVFDSVWIPDHFQLGAHDVVECWTTMSHFAALYPSLQFGTMVVAHSFRNPALLAKMAATLHYLTDGRLILGLGAGWNEEEYRAYGYDFPPGGVRVEQFDEAVQVIKALWSGGPVSFAGRHYTIDEARCEPRHSPAPLLMIGAKKPRMLRLAARHADWWNIDWTGPASTRALVQEMLRACADTGRDPATLRKSWLGLCSCAREQAAAHQALDEGEFFKGQAQEGIVGTPAQVLAQFRAYIELGIDDFMIATARFPDPRTLDLLIEKVIPQLKAEYGEASRPEN
jgi:alkanesulfonate monooxygenase SsuD/methylene tetrahydromethanopterin reductase-like flavin-dependent oxidoreductase (luciferase family)